MSEQPKPSPEPAPVVPAEKTVEPKAEDANVLLCRKVVTKLGKPEAEAECAVVLKGFTGKEDFDKTTLELSRILGKPREEVVRAIAED